MHDSCFLYPSPVVAFGAIYHEHSVRKWDSTVSIRTILETGPPGTDALVHPDRIWNYPASSCVGTIDKTPRREYDVRLQPRVRNASKLYLHSPMHLRGFSVRCAQSRIYVWGEGGEDTGHKGLIQNLHVMRTSGINAPTYFVDRRYVTWCHAPGMFRAPWGQAA